MLESKTELADTLRQFTEPAVEEELIGLLNARRMFWHSRNGGSMADSLSSEQLNAVESITIKDSVFVIWVDSLLGPSNGIVPMQEKVMLVCRKHNVQTVLKKLEDGRNSTLMRHLVSQGADTARINVYTEDPEKITPSETRSKFLIEFGVE